MLVRYFWAGQRDSLGLVVLSPWKMSSTEAEVVAKEEEKSTEDYDKFKYDKVIKRQKHFSAVHNVT